MPNKRLPDNAWQRQPMGERPRNRYVRWMPEPLLTNASVPICAFLNPAAPSYAGNQGFVRVAWYNNDGVFTGRAVGRGQVPVTVCDVWLADAFVSTDNGQSLNSARQQGDLPATIT